MSTTRKMMGAGASVLALLASLAIPAESFAAVLPHTQAVPDAQPTPQAPMQQSASSSNGDPGYIMLADLVKACETPAHPERCDTPRAARPSTIAEDTPLVSRQEYLTRYPQMGMAGYKMVQTSNRNLCETMTNFLVGINQLDQLFVVVGNEYEILQGIYNELPGAVKRGTAVMLVSQAAQAGTLCILSAGLYCIAAVFGAIGNSAVTIANQKLQLANIRVTIAQIVLSKLSVWSNRLTLRLDANWIWLGYPGCRKLGWDTIANLPDLPPMPTLPAGFGESVKHQVPPDRHQRW